MWKKGHIKPDCPDLNKALYIEDIANLDLVPLEVEEPVDTDSIYSFSELNTDSSDYSDFSNDNDSEPEIPINMINFSFFTITSSPQEFGFTSQTPSSLWPI